jgi:hypothetical protein
MMAGDGQEAWRIYAENRMAWWRACEIVTPPRVIELVLPPRRWGLARAVRR